MTIIWKSEMPSVVVFQHRRVSPKESEPFFGQLESWPMAISTSITTLFYMSPKLHVGGACNLQIMGKLVEALLVAL